MEAQPPHSNVSRTVQPTRLAFPPDGFVSVAPQTAHEMTVVAREKITVSLPQSLHETFINWPTIFLTSSIYEFEFLGSLAWSIVSLTRFSATVKNVNTLGWLFTAIRLWTWETTISSHHFSEPSLTPAKFRGSLFLDTLNSMERVLTSRRAVALDLTWHLDHGLHLNSLATIDGYLLLSSHNSVKKSRTESRIAAILISRAR